MDIAHLCRRELVCVDVGASLRDAAAILHQEHVGAVLATRAADGDVRQVAGLVTDRDFAIEVIAQGFDPASLRVGDLPHAKDFIQLSGSTGFAECAATMHRLGVRHVVVVDAEGGVIGIVSAEDLVAAISEELDNVVEALRSGNAREAIMVASPSALRPLIVPPHPLRPH